jgi:hypothetical protein
VYGCGASEHGQLGDTHVAQACLEVPVQLWLQAGDPAQRPALTVACGDHTLSVCCPEACFPACYAQLHTCSTLAGIPDILALAKAARPGGSAAVAAADAREHSRTVQTLITAIQNVFSSPGLLVSGFSLPPAPRADPDGAPSEEAAHNLDLDAIKDVFEAILLVLESEVVLALQSTIATLLQRIFQREEISSARGSVSTLSQAQWLKVWLRVCLCAGLLLTHTKLYLPRLCAGLPDIPTRSCCTPQRHRLTASSALVPVNSSVAPCRSSSMPQHAEQLGPVAREARTGTGTHRHRVNRW